MFVTGVGNGVPYPDLYQERTSVKPQVLPGEGRASEDFAVVLPGERDTTDIKAKVADLEKVSLAFNRKLQFVVDLETNQILVKVIDPETDKVIKILPPEELQRLHSKIRETIGFLFDEQV